MGRSKDLEKTIRFMHLHLLYRKNQYDEKLFLQWFDSPHMTTSMFKRKKKVLGLIEMDNYYDSPWNEVLNPLVSEFTFGQDSISD